VARLLVVTPVSRAVLLLLLVGLPQLAHQLVRRVASLLLLVGLQLPVHPVVCPVRRVALLLQGLSQLHLHLHLQLRARKRELSLALHLREPSPALLRQLQARRKRVGNLRRLHQHLRPHLVSPLR
jgi:hypothetical protein